MSGIGEGAITRGPINPSTLAEGRMALAAPQQRPQAAYEPQAFIQHSWQGATMCLGFGRPAGFTKLADASMRASVDTLARAATGRVSAATINSNGNNWAVTRIFTG
ncbi:hypothetical protein LMTR13_36275 [Bradyrhizobium icense]|uniref:Uncharacterized protein n=1 Tax=Bradyrhizobium icense TaxID=1274631 RepID=A0A1B1UPP9_9BRAD|nr:hypothetical protein LMTR13_36275 [Bradyrhizobium icense]